METEQLLSSIPKPSKFSIFWLRVYFSHDPISIFGEPGLIYVNGYIHSLHPRNSPAKYWLGETNTHWLFQYHFYMQQVLGIDYESGLYSLIGKDIKNFLISMCSCLFGYPLISQRPYMSILSWLISITVFIMIIPKDIRCFVFIIYHAFSVLILLTFLLFIAFEIKTLQIIHNQYYPGTPGVKVDVPGLISFYHLSAYRYKWILIPLSLLLLLLGFANFSLIFLYDGGDCEPS